MGDWEQSTSTSTERYIMYSYFALVVKSPYDVCKFAAHQMLGEMPSRSSCFASAVWLPGHSNSSC